MNLATNAAQAMAGKGGGTLAIEVTSFVPDESFASLHPAVRASVPYVHLNVTDTGSGIERAVVDRIFEPFFTTKPGHEGTGLGLATVHGIVTSLGGAIDVYSEIGHGATFRIYLPRVIGPATSPHPVEPSPANSGTGRILLVDDEESIRTMTERMLVRLGYDVTTAPDGLAAEQTFSADPTAFDIVVADLTMPGLGGAGLIRAIHALRPELPAILTSGFGDSIPAAERAGLDLASFLQKPYTRAELASQVHQALLSVPRAPTGAPVGA
jgi:CheY-like chemotaxis protein